MAIQFIPGEYYWMEIDGRDEVIQCTNTDTFPEFVRTGDKTKWSTIGDDIRYVGAVHIERPPKKKEYDLTLDNAPVILKTESGYTPCRTVIQALEMAGERDCTILVHHPEKDRTIKIKRMGQGERYTENINDNPNMVKVFLQYVGVPSNSHVVLIGNYFFAISPNGKYYYAEGPSSWHEVERESALRYLKYKGIDVPEFKEDSE